MKVVTYSIFLEFSKFEENKILKLNKQWKIFPSQMQEQGSKSEIAIDQTSKIARSIPLKARNTNCNNLEGPQNRGNLGIASGQSSMGGNLLGKLPTLQQGRPCQQGPPSPTMVVGLEAASGLQAWASPLFKFSFSLFSLLLGDIGWEYFF